MTEIYYREVNAKWSEDLLAISVCRYRVVRETPKGVWIVPDWAFGRDDMKNWEKFILHTSGKKFAWPTREEARTSFIARKHREIMLTARQHDRAVRYLKLAETMQYGEESNALHEIHVAGIHLIEPLI